MSASDRKRSIIASRPFRVVVQLLSIERQSSSIWFLFCNMIQLLLQCPEIYHSILAIMLRLLNCKPRFFLASTPVQAPRKGRSVTVPKQNIPPQIAHSQHMAKLYLEFESLPTDSLSIVRTRFIKKKQHFSSRRMYIPNKKQYMLSLDNALRQIQQNKSVQVNRQNYMMPRTIGERIQIQLQEQEKQFYSDLLKNDRYQAIGAACLIALLAVVEIQFCEIA